MRLTRRFLDDGTMWRGAPLCVGVIGNHLVDEVLFEIPATFDGYLVF